MKVKYLGETSPLELIHGKVYEVLSIEGEWYRIVDETDEDYLYPPEDFEVIEPDDGTIPVKDQHHSQGLRPGLLS